MLTGMRAMDMEGRITYVNPAFCAMTGFSEADLIGRLPPFPYWPPDRIDENARLLQQELQGRSPAGGIEVKVMRKDGSVFDARMYVSPLIDPKGQQTGWMTSMTNITEAKRIRDQLSASHERFTTVLEGPRRRGVGAVGAAGRAAVRQPLVPALVRRRCAAAMRCSPAATPALPFAADGDDAVDDARRPADAGADRSRLRPARGLRRAAAEVVRRARALPAVDRRPAGADADRHRHHRAAQRRGRWPRSQAEKAQVTSRLVTMGEMASSVAHELNQPLTAITNYCNGMVSRVENDAIDKADLIAALQKTSRQAERAGQIIHRIRAFVKRSEPQRQTAAGADDRRRRGRPRRHRAAPAQRRDPHLRRAAPAAADGRPDPDRAGGAEPAEERRRGDRQRAAAGRAPATSSCASCRATRPKKAA